MAKKKAMVLSGFLGGDCFKSRPKQSTPVGFALLQVPVLVPPRQPAVPAIQHPPAPFSCHASLLLLYKSPQKC